MRQKPFAVRLAWSSTLLALLAGAGACPDGEGTFDGGILPDAGPDAGLIDIAGIGTRCRYDPATGLNPSNECPSGLGCLVQTPDGRFAPMGIDLWEDHFTTFGESPGVVDGYCTILGPPEVVATCPAGTIGKLLTGTQLVNNVPAAGIGACLKPCTGEADCGDPAYTCDFRFFDLLDNAGTSFGSCVRKCVVDYPECVRTGVLASPRGNNVTYLALQDLSGGSQCNRTTGVCEFTPSVGAAGPGQPCDRTQDCNGGICIQKEVLELVSGQVVERGFCAAACKPDPNNPQGTCTEGFRCQAGLTLGLPDPLGPLDDDVGVNVVDLVSGELFEAGGFCFPQCQDFNNLCDQFPGTLCGGADSQVFGELANPDSMCLPDVLRR